MTCKLVYRLDQRQHGIASGSILADLFITPLVKVRVVSILLEVLVFAYIIFGYLPFALFYDAIFYTSILLICETLLVPLSQ